MLLQPNNEKRTLAELFTEIHEKLCNNTAARFSEEIVDVISTGISKKKSNN
nr:hypothetical protein [Candidatus Vallotia lariciata]